MDDEEEEFYTKTVHSEEVPVPGADPETIAMEMWYWTTLDWLTSEFELTKEQIVEFALQDPVGETLAENVKTAIYTLFHSYDKVFNPEEYDGSGFDDKAPDAFLIQDALELMGVEENYSEEELKKQYWARLSKIHPDLNDQFNEAFGILKRELEKKV